MRTFLAVTIGGAIGSSLRFLVSHIVQENTMVGFPIATLTVNVVGCLLIGFFYGIPALNSGNNELKALLTTGLCGGFTTFSTFCNENLMLLRGGNSLTSMAYAVCSLVGGLLAVVAGYELAALLWQRN